MTQHLTCSRGMSKKAGAITLLQYLAFSNIPPASLNLANFSARLRSERMLLALALSEGGSFASAEVMDILGRNDNLQEEKKIVQDTSVCAANY